MAEKDTIIKIGLESDLAGGVQTQKQLDEIKKKAKELGNEGAAGAGKATTAFARLQAATGTLRKVLTGFGVAGLFSGLISQIGRIAESFRSAKKSADELFKVQLQLAQEKGVQKLAADYDRLKESIAAASREQQHSLDMVDEDVKNRRRLEGAQRGAAKERELSALDPDDPAYEQKKAAIEARYAGEEAAAAASNAKEDIVLQRQRYESQATEKEGEAKAQDAQSEVIRRKIANAQRAKGAAEVAAVSLNDEDKTDAISAVGKTMGQLLTGDWGRMAGAKTKEGDAVRQSAANEAAAKELEIDALREELRKSEERAAELRKEAERLRERRDKAGETLKAAEIEGDTASSVAQRGKTAAGRALSQKQSQIAKDELTVTEGRGVIASLKQQDASERARAQEAANRYAKEAGDVVNAQNAYDMVVANGGSRRDRSAALAALQKEQREAEEAKHEMETVAAQVAATLGAIKEQISSLSRAVKSAQGRLAQNQADAPEG